MKSHQVSRRLFGEAVADLPTAGKRWRYKRDMLIRFLAKKGWSTRLIADVLDLSPKRVRTIIGGAETPTPLDSGPA